MGVMSKLNIAMEYIDTNPLGLISELVRYAYKAWLPASGYDLGDAPDTELYYGKNGDSHRRRNLNFR